MAKKTRRKHNVTPVRRLRGDVYFILKLKLTDADFDLITVPHRDMICKIVQEGVGNYIGSIDGLPDDCPLLDANKDAATALETLNIWSNELGTFKIGIVYWVDEDLST